MEAGEFLQTMSLGRAISEMSIMQTANTAEEGEPIWYSRSAVFPTDRSMGRPHPGILVVGRRQSGYPAEGVPPFMAIDHLPQRGTGLMSDTVTLEQVEALATQLA